MKKTLLSIAFFGAALSLFSQTIVSTTPENKKVILEEFTGIHCGYCPDGHRIAHEIMAANPGKVFMIALHQGGYAAPAAGEPDYRTSFGNSIAGQTGLTGYPAGTVNRHIFAGSTTALDRGSWNSSSNTIKSQLSCVNVGVTANINYLTRELTVHCEVYYTANSTVPTNALNVALLQNNIKGPQSDYGNYNPTMNTPDGLYMHQHMLRHLITGQWGETISTTTAGTFVDKTYTYTIPANYTSVPVDLTQLEVVAFVSQGNQEILSGNGCYVNQPTNNAAVTDISSVPSMFCSGNFTPSITIKNNGTDVLTSLTINYQTDAGTVANIPWTGSLATGTTEVVNLPEITPIDGSHVFKVWSQDPNGQPDMNNLDDSYSTNYNALFSIISPDVTQDFTSAAFPPANWFSIDVTPDGKNWSKASVGHAAAGAAKISFYDITNPNVDALNLFTVDLTNRTNTNFSFWIAHRRYNASYIDRLDVEVSTDCGATWTSKWNKSGTALATGADMTSAFTAPSAAEWRKETVNLSAYNGMNNVNIRFKATSGYGNNAYIDDITLSSWTVGVNDITDQNSIKIFPNPASDFIQIENAANTEYQILNITGTVSLKGKINSTEEKIDVSTLSQGIYFIRLSNEKGNNELKINIVK